MIRYSDSPRMWVDNREFAVSTIILAEHRLQTFSRPFSPRLVCSFSVPISIGSMWPSVSDVVASQRRRRNP